MEVKITGYYESFEECEILLCDNGKAFHLFISEIDVTLSMNDEGYGNVKIDHIRCLDISTEDCDQVIVLTPEQIKAIEIEMIDHIDWISWMEMKYQKDDDYEDRKFNSMD